MRILQIYILISKIPATALSFVASAPKPYTVSVGKATKPPLIIAWLAAFMLLAVGVNMGT